MLSELLKEQQKAIEYFFDQVDIEKMEEVFQACLQSKGLLFFTGVGKSGIIAEKIAMTLTSTGSRALFLPVVNFLHGDIGILSENDVVFLLSKSGETEELLALIPHMKKRGAKLIAIVSKRDSNLEKSCDLSLFLPVLKELCPFDLAPTISTTVQLLFGDVLAMGLMRAKNFSLNDYALTHPSGTLGKKITVKVADVMLKNEQIPFCHPEDSLKSILSSLSSKKCGCQLVVDPEKKILGIFTDGDLRRAIEAHGAEILEEKIGNLMTKSYTSTHPEILAWEALKLMQQDSKKWMMILPVVDQEKRVVGILRMHDIVQAGI